MPAGLNLVAGGVRSGKSRFALQLAEGHPSPRIFVATAQVLDHEMQIRVAAHQRERNNRYATIEEPLELPQVLVQANPNAVVVVDCLTLWLSNLLLADRSELDIRRKIKEVIAARIGCPGATIFVSNEVGMGIVPENTLARRFRDLSGIMHQTIAGRCHGLYLAAMGTVLRLRPAPVEVCDNIGMGSVFTIVPS